MVKSLFLFILICSFPAIVFSQTKSLNSISQHDLKKHLNVIASDSLQGRSFGTEVPGLNMAADYLANNARSIGLKTGFQNYFQKVKITSSHADKENTFLEISDNKGDILFKTNSLIDLSGGSEIDIQNRELVFAGFGWRDEESGYYDFKDLDLMGKVVLISAGSPGSFLKKEPFNWNSRVENSKMRRAKEAGALAVVMINSLFDENNNTYNRVNAWMNRGGYSLQTPEKPSGNNFILTTPDFADVVLGKGKLKKILTKMAKKGKSHSFVIPNFKVTAVAKRKIETIEAKNIVGIVEGSDPVLKNECVVFMAHYDHLGIDKDGDVFNGADDNGSGVVTIMEVAEAFTKLEQKPKRSIVFLWVTGEEVGMLGSKYYAGNPIFPMEKTVACINIDMDGRVYESRDTVWNDSPKKVKDFDGLFTLANNVWPGLKKINSTACEKLGIIPDYSLPDNFLRSSDHYSFHKNGVPILNYATGYHADYHKATDEISRINFEKMKRVADLCFLVGYEIANRETIEFEREIEK